MRTHTHTHKKKKKKKKKKAKGSHPHEALPSQVSRVGIAAAGAQRGRGVARAVHQRQRIHTPRLMTCQIKNKRYKAANETKDWF